MDGDRHRFFQSIHGELQLACDNANGHLRLIRKCREVQPKLKFYPDPDYFPCRFNSTCHERVESVYQNFLSLLTDNDPDADLRELNPIRITNDGSALFRSVALSLGLNSEEDALELRVRCLVDAIVNKDEYKREDPELLEGLDDPEQTTIAHWAHLITEKDRMIEPNAITVLTLVSLAKLTKRPIRSVYFPRMSTEQLSLEDSSLYKKINRVFLPNADQNNESRLQRRPITILWKSEVDKNNRVSIHVLPLLQNDLFCNIRKRSGPLMQGTDNINRTTLASPLPILKTRCTYVLIAFTVNSMRESDVIKHSQQMKINIIEYLKQRAKDAKNGDLIEVNQCDEKLPHSPVIPFCLTVDVASEQNLSLIKDMKLIRSKRADIIACIFVATNKMAKKSTYYSDFILFADHSNLSAMEISSQRNIICVLDRKYNVNVQMIDTRNVLADENTSYNAQHTSDINSSCTRNNMSRYQSNSIVRKISIIYGYLIYRRKNKLRQVSSILILILRSPNITQIPCQQLDIHQTRRHIMRRRQL
ncbi:unnamed protein product [Adineta ricciae]|uniref:Uncharacterized protein n=1 Tax=Adineta ricciae TaxID=249248 RepID=A0A815TI51_ADIRI|nr:unnamed protein product [Adineta ricciae]